LTHTRIETRQVTAVCNSREYGDRHPGAYTCGHYTDPIIVT